MGEDQGQRQTPRTLHHQESAAVVLCLESDETPRSAKLIVYGSLAYLILPVNLISQKRHPILGWADEVAAIAIAYRKVKQHITPEMDRQAEETLDKWF